MFSRLSRQNPVLEIKRDAYLAAEKEIQDNLVDNYKLALSKTKHIHASLLFTTHYGHLILKEICRLVTYIDPSVYSTSWRDFAAKLGYGDIDVKCINNLRGDVYDPTELAIQYYAVTKEEGTVGAILEALLDLGFLPALHQAQEHVDKFVAEVDACKDDVIEAPIDKEPDVKSLLKAANFKPSVPAIFDSTLKKEYAINKVDSWYNNVQMEETVQTSSPPPNFKPSVPATFDSSPTKVYAVKKMESFYNNVRMEETVQRSRPPDKADPNKAKIHCKRVMLSFASDGYATALRLAAVLRATKNKKGYPIGVLTLHENENKILCNPGQMIPEILSKMDFVIPVLTEGYFTALNRPDPNAQLLDERYIHFIHDILISKYIHNNCLNVQVRCVIPSPLVNTIYNKDEFIHNTLFSAWKTDDEMPALADNIVKARRIIVSA